MVALDASREGAASAQVYVPGPNAVGHARRVLGAFAASAGLGRQGVERARLVVTELANNVAHHGGGGEVHACSVPGPEGRARVDLLAIDGGPGIPDVTSALRDGFSSSGTLGSGLGAVARQSDQWDIYTRSGHGCVVLASILGPTGSGAARRADPWSGQRYEIGVVSRPVSGETENGDGVDVRVVGDACLLVVVDGLGHGAGAAEARRCGIERLRSRAMTGAEGAMRGLHEGMKGTRGAAASVTLVAPGDERLEHVAVGNVEGAVVDDEGRSSLLTRPGLVGMSLPELEGHTVSIGPRSRLILHTDGIRGGWSLTDYPGLSARAPAVVAGVLYRDFARDSDDATVLVGGFRTASDDPGGRWNGTPPARTARPADGRTSHG